MNEPLDKPFKKLSVKELEDEIRKEIIKALQIEKDKSVIYNDLTKTYGSKNAKFIYGELIQYASSYDKHRLSSVQTIVLVGLLSSGIISTFLYYFFGNLYPQGNAVVSIVAQVITTSFLIYKLTQFTRGAISMIQILVLVKFILVFINILNRRYPSQVYLYLAILGGIYFLTQHLKKEGFSKKKYFDKSVKA